MHLRFDKIKKIDSNLNHLCGPGSMALFFLLYMDIGEEISKWSCSWLALFNQNYGTELPFVHSKGNYKRERPHETSMEIGSCPHILETPGGTWLHGEIKSNPKVWPEGKVKSQEIRQDDEIDTRTQLGKRSYGILRQCCYIWGHWRRMVVGQKKKRRKKKGSVFWRRGTKVIGARERWWPIEATQW